MNLAKASPSAMDGLIPSPKAPLLGQVREVMRVHHYSLRTEEAYLQLCGSEGNGGFTPPLFSLFAPVHAGDSIVRPGQPDSEQEATEGKEASLLLCDSELGIASAGIYRSRRAGTRRSGTA